MPETASSIAARVRAGELTARAAVDAALARIAVADASTGAGGRPGLGAYQVVRADAARTEADAVDARPDRADLPLAGVPVAIKDNVPVQGEPMRIGSLATDPGPQRSDHEVVRRLRAAGAVVVGITRVPELCVFGTTDSAFGITRNPWDVERTPGGSSGGAAAAVAAGTVPVAHGNDGMGSVRIPAACCGLVGLKPGSGVVPAELGDARSAAGAWFGLAENGVLATTVQDAAAAFAVLADRPGDARLPEAGRLRVAVSTRAPAPGVRVHRAWRNAALTTGALLQASGHAVRPADPAYGALLGARALVRWTAGTEMDAQATHDRTQLARRTRRHAALGWAALALGLPREAGRRRWRAAAERFFTDVDVLVTPMLAAAPPLARAWAERSWTANVVSNLRYAPFAAPWNLAGWPAICVPAGLDSHGLPLAVQLVGPPGTESRLLAVAAQLETQRPWTRVAPAFDDTAPGV